jgi:hypothetical protein
MVLRSSRGYRGHRVATSMSGSFRLGSGSDLSLSLLHSARGVTRSSHGVYVHHVGETGVPRTIKSPFLVRQMPVMVLYWRELKSLGFAMDEQGEHQDLRSSARRSVIPYAHGRMRVVLLKRWLFSWLPCVALRVLTPTVVFYSTRLLRSHCASGPDRWPQGGCTLYRRGTLARNSQ